MPEPITPLSDERSAELGALAKAFLASIEPTVRAFDPQYEALEIPLKRGLLISWAVQALTTYGAHPPEARLPQLAYGFGLGFGGLISTQLPPAQHHLVAVFNEAMAHAMSRCLGTMPTEGPQQ